MNINELVKSKTDRRLIDTNPQFFKKCLEFFGYLIFDFSFDKAKIDVSGREYSVAFSKGKTSVQIVHEAGILPQLFLKDKFGNEIEPKKIIPELGLHISRTKFPIHFKVQDAINAKYNSTKDYIKIVGQAWDKNKEAGSAEIEGCLKLLGTELKNKLVHIL